MSKINEAVKAPQVANDSKVKKPASKKQLTPSKFGLANEQPHTRGKLLSHIPRVLTTFDQLGHTQPTSYPGYAPRMIAACRLLLKSSSVDGTPNTPLPFPARSWPKGITTEELAIIGSDFGEVAGALYLLSTKQITIKRGNATVPLQFKHIMFPSDPANKLVDYVAVTTDDAHYKISAKYKKGGAPALSAVEHVIQKWLRQTNWANLSKVGLRRDTHFTALSVMNLLGIERENPAKGMSDLFTGPLEAAQFLTYVDPSSRPAKAYTALEAALAATPDGKNWARAAAMTVYDMEEIVAALGHSETTDKDIDVLWKKMEKWLTPYWTAAGIVGKFDIAAIKSGWTKPKKPRIGPLHFPITYALLNWLNDPANGALDVLTAAARTLQVCQLRLMNLDKAPSKGVVYRWEPFNENNFEFWSPSHTVLPLNNRMGFRLK